MSEFPFTSAREWISFLEERGKLARNKREVNLERDVAAIQKLATRRGAEAVLHEEIRGYPGWRILSGSFGTVDRLAWALGSEPQEAMKYVPLRVDVRIPPMLVGSGPCKEVVLRGKKADLTKLPSPFCMWGVEGTPSITAGICNVLDPETGWQDVSLRRFSIKGKRRLSYVIKVGYHDALIWQKYRRARTDMPITIVINPDPTSFLMSALRTPVGVCGYEVWGAFTGSPLELVKSETSELMVPASSEIVVEGRVLPEDRELDGPFPDILGYNTTICAAARVEVEAITMRADPIFYFLESGPAPAEADTLLNHMNAFCFLRELSKRFPGILAITCRVGGYITIVQVDKMVAKNWPQFAVQVADYLKTVLLSHLKLVIVVDQDVSDIEDLDQVVTAICAKFQASKDVTIVPRTMGSMLDPSEVWAGRRGWTDFMIMDCTEKQPPWDESYKRGMAIPPPDIMKKVRERWPEYGFKD